MFNHYLLCRNVHFAVYTVDTTFLGHSQIPQISERQRRIANSGWKTGHVAAALRMPRCLSGLQSSARHPVAKRIATWLIGGFNMFQPILIQIRFLKLWEINTKRQNIVETTGHSGRKRSNVSCKSARRRQSLVVHSSPFFGYMHPWYPCQIVHIGHGYLQYRGSRAVAYITAEYYYSHVVSTKSRPCRVLHDHGLYMYIYIIKYTPVVLHRAVAEVSIIGNL